MLPLQPMNLPEIIGGVMILWTLMGLLAGFGLFLVVQGLSAVFRGLASPGIATALAGILCIVLAYRWVFLGG